jgi:hypothetical protein
MRWFCFLMVSLAAACFVNSGQAMAADAAPTASAPAAAPRVPPLADIEAVQKKIEAVQKDAALSADQKTKAIQTEIDAAKKTIGGKTWTMTAVIMEVKRTPPSSTGSGQPARLDVTVSVRQLGLEGIVLSKDVADASTTSPSTVFISRARVSSALPPTVSGDPQIGDTVKVGLGCDVALADGKAALLVSEMHLAGSEKSRFFDPPLVVKPDAAKAPAAAGGRNTFYGVEATAARKIVYIIDRSGSMTDSMDYVKHELKRSIDSLKDDQEFHVIFYSSGPPLEMPTRRLVNATERNKQLAFEFVDGIVPQGETDPSKAIERAFACQPETIFLLTDGEFDKSIVDLCKRLNEGKKVTIHAIGFLYQTGAEVLKQIANDNGGAYKFVSEKDLANLAK